MYDENMSGSLILLFSVIWVIVAYLRYGKRIEKQLVAPLDKEEVPSVKYRDGKDFSPASKMVLFGHHFSSIAGAGPIVGPIIAVAAFGWGTALVWILIAGVFIGAVHDYLSLVISVRNDGISIPESAGRFVSQRGRMLFLTFVWLTIILVIAVFGDFAAKALASTPALVVPTFLLIPLSILFGFANKRKLLPLAVLTLLAVAGLTGLIWLGFAFPIVLPFSAEMIYGIWFTLLLAYGFAASVTPVWILLQPRDYISSWVLIIGVVLAVTGIFIVSPEMNAPAYTSFVHPVHGPILPFLFIIIACGAVSGFHSIIAGGTSSKQLAREKDALPIGYGSMLVETVIGVICIIIAGGVLSWGNSSGELLWLLNPVNKGNPLTVFGAGFGKLTSFIFGSELGKVIGITVVNVFIMTTLDTSVRLGRFLTGELAGEKFPKLKKKTLLITLIPVVPAFFLGISGQWKIIWPLFGASNQLVAAIVLIIISAWLHKKGKKTRYTLWATVFMTVTTISALGWLAWKYLFSASPNYFLGVIAIVLIWLALTMAYEGLSLLKKRNEPETQMRKSG